MKRTLILLILTISFLFGQGKFEVGINTGIATDWGSYHKIGLTGDILIGYKFSEKFSTSIEFGKIIYGSSYDNVYNSSTIKLAFMGTYKFNTGKLKPFITTGLELQFHDAITGFQEYTIPPYPGTHLKVDVETGRVISLNIGIGLSYAVSNKTDISIGAVEAGILVKEMQKGLGGYTKIFIGMKHSL